MLWGGRWEGGSCLGTHVRIKDFKIKKKKKFRVISPIQRITVIEYGFFLLLFLCPFEPKMNKGGGNVYLFWCWFISLARHLSIFKLHLLNEKLLTSSENCFKYQT